MSTKLNLTKLAALGGLAFVTIAQSTGCVADRPSRNGVFNENQYIRKDFLVRPGDSNNPDYGWMLKATIVEASEPNVFGGDLFGLFSGSHNYGELMHFIVTQDKMQMVSNREISGEYGQAGYIGVQHEVVNAWPVTNVDLKYQVNLDGEKTNFYQENQELDWQSRQWVKVNLDKNDMSDLAPLGSYTNANLQTCADIGNASATLVPNSFQVDEAHNYMEWSVQVTLPIKWTADCIEAYGPMGDAAARLGRDYETVTLKYSMVRSEGKPTYQPLVVDEKDKILKKYGPISFNTVVRDPSTGLLGAQTFVTRFDPTKPIDWYFEQGFPAKYMPYFTKNGLPSGTSAIDGIVTIEDQTNQVLTDSGVAARVKFHQGNEPMADGTQITRQFGDVRWNMLRWLESEDQQPTFAGAESDVVDPRSGQKISSDIVFENFAIKDYYVTRIDAYLQAVGACGDGTPMSGQACQGPFTSTPWPDSPLDAMGNAIMCSSSNIGASVPIVTKQVQVNHNAQSTLFQKMQTYLYKPAGQFGPLGPQDFIAKHQDALDATKPDQDFFKAYYAYLPYIIFRDPATNPFVTAEGGAANTGAGMSSQIWQMIHQEQQLHELMGKLDRGWAPFDVSGADGEANAVSFMHTLKDMTINHRNLKYARAEVPYMPGVGQPLVHMDTPDSFAMISAIQRDGRHCVNTGGNTHWETKQEWIDSLVNTYWSQVFWHEFGHAMSLDHNFIASVDAPNFPGADQPSMLPKNADGTTRYSLYANSVMEYNAAVDRVFWTPGWAPYDQGAISWVYANNMRQDDMACGAMSTSYSGQVSATCPWKDPHGFYTADTDANAIVPHKSGDERGFLYCNDTHSKYTPLCRAGDIGVTPSEITANELDAYEWQYKWRNFRQYRKIWDDSMYGDTPLNLVTELRRFLSLWTYDMSSSELTQRFGQIGIMPPANAPSAQYYYDQLTRKFANEMAASGTLSASFHEAIVQQSAGARPYVTVFDNYFGDVTQQGIFLDKLFAVQSFATLWPVDNYDQNQAAGSYITSYSQYGTTYYTDQVAIGSLYATVAEQGIQSMLGGAFDAFYYAKPLAVAQFTFDTHTPQYLGSNAAPARAEAQDWAGGYQFYRLDDFLAFFRDIAIANNFKAALPDGTVIDCTTDVIDNCHYDPRLPRAYPSDDFLSDTYNRFLGPDGRRWIWAYLQDRNTWVVADQDRNVSTYPSIFNYTSDVIFGKDDGNFGPAYGYALQLKYMLDYYDQALQIK